MDERIVALRILHRGQEFGLSLVTVSGCRVDVQPFDRETASTTFHSGTIRILRAGANSATDWHREGDVPMLVKES